jgi:hypothetical protein
MKMVEGINCDYCGAELKNYPFFYKLGRFIKKDLICPVCFDEYFKGNLGKDKAQKYDSKTMKQIEG